MFSFPATNIAFMRYLRQFFSLSAVLMILSLALLFTRGLNFGIDFTGGTLIEVGYSEPVELEMVRGRLDAAGFDRTTVQYIGTSHEVLIRLAPREGEASSDLADRVFAQLSQGQRVELRRVEFVGPQAGDELREKGGLALLYAIVGILIYVALRFEWRFSVGAVLALAHDVIVTLGYFSLTYTEFDLTVLAAILAVIGYSLNDSIVVFDRIRENFRTMRKESVEMIMNSAINQTLSRTLNTGLTTLIVLFALLLFGGPAVHGFALALIVGILFGTYSSVYVASGLALLLGVDRAVLAPVKKAGSEDGAQV